MITGLHLKLLSTASAAYHSVVEDDRCAISSLAAYYP